MKFHQYLWDRRYLFLFYLVLMCLISSIVYLDSTVKVSGGNIIYLNVVALVLLFLYLLGEFFRYKRSFQHIMYVLDHVEKDLIYSLPEAITHEQDLYLKLMKKMYADQNFTLKELFKDKQDSLEFITSWVHEVKTPIAACRLVIEDRAGKPSKETFKSVEEELDKIEAHVERALYYSKIDAFSKDYLISEQNLDHLIKKVIKKNAKTFIYKKIKIELSDLNLIVTTDHKWLIFIFNQILSNALKYTDSGGTIRIFGEADQKEKRLTIEDNGIGIPSEDVGRIFEKGFTGTRGREDYKATGMGLYLVKKLAQKLGHEISVESVHGEYTKMIIHFPRLTNYFLA